MNGSGGIEVFQTMLEHRESRLKELKEQAEELEREVDSIRHTLDMYMRDHGIPTISPAPLLEHGLTLTKRRERALIQWAEGNQNILIPKEAKKALIAAGLIKPGKGAGWIVYGTISNMDCWQKLQPGVYRLDYPEVIEDEFGNRMQIVVR